MSEHKNIFVYCEMAGKAPANVTFELLGKAAELKEKTGGQVVAVLLGHDTGNAAVELCAHGADRVLRVESANLAVYKPVPFASTLRALVLKHKPAIMLFGATAQGRDLAPRLQAKLRTGLTADCLELDVNEEDLLVQTKPSFGGNIMCTIVCPQARPQMATVRPGVFNRPARNPGAPCNVVDETPEVAPDDDYQVISGNTAAGPGVDIGTAEVVIALGRGACSEEAVAAARELAAVLNGAVGVTRPLADEGKFAPDCQIGQTGKTVKPKCILNFGISGAIQYQTGMRDSGLIISVNKDRAAPIFDVSQFGVVGDATQVLCELLGLINKTEKTD